eukprot:gene8512-biopygen3134
MLRSARASSHSVHTLAHGATAPTASLLPGGEECCANALHTRETAQLNRRTGHARATPAPPKPKKKKPIARATPAPCPHHCPRRTPSRRPLLCLGETATGADRTRTGPHDEIQRNGRGPDAGVAVSPPAVFVCWSAGD